MFVMKIFIILLFQSSWMHSFNNIYRIQFKCKLCKDNNICYENFHRISVPDFMDVSFMVFIEFISKCKLCKDSNICYKNFHHVSVPDLMDAYFYSISRIQFKCKLCKDNNICY